MRQLLIMVDLDWFSIFCAVSERMKRETEKQNGRHLTQMPRPAVDTSSNAIIIGVLRSPCIGKMLLNEWQSVLGTTLYQKL